jgi:hypothetical protein
MAQPSNPQNKKPGSARVFSPQPGRKMVSQEINRPRLGNRQVKTTVVQAFKPCRLHLTPERAHAYKCFY